MGFKINTMATIAENLTTLKSTKASIKAAIEAKGVSNVGDKFSDYPSKIASIPTGSSALGSLNGLCFGYSQGDYNTVGKQINELLNGSGTLFRLHSMFRDVQIDNYWVVDLSNKVLTQTAVVDATGMFYNSKTGGLKWPIQPGAGTTQVKATLMFASCNMYGAEVTWPYWITVTDAGSMFAGSTFSMLNLGGLDLATNNVTAEGIAGGILYNTNVQIIYFEGSFFNQKDNYDFSSLGSLTGFGVYTLSDGSEGWQSMVGAMTLTTHPNQTLTLPQAWQTYIQQYNLESQLTSAWNSVIYQ